MKHAISSLVVATVLFQAHSALAQSGPQNRGPYHHEEHNSQAAIAREVQCLTQTAASLEQLFADHLRRNRPRPTRSELDFAGALHGLNEDIEHFVRDLQGGEDKNHLYRTFHMMDYSVQDAWALAAQAGYARSLNGWLSDIDEHVRNLGEQGMRNPRFQQIQMDNRFHGQYRSQQGEHQFSAPPVYDQRGVRINQAQPQPNVGRPSERPRDGEVRINIGDALGRLFGGRR